MKLAGERISGRLTWSHENKSATLHKFNNLSSANKEFDAEDSEETIRNCVLV
jgi:hypothetical protein